MEARENASTVALRFVEGDEKDTNIWGHSLASLSRQDMTAETWSSRSQVGRKADNFNL
jgi:hypothetical protein